MSDQIKDKKSDKNWPKDEFGHGEVIQFSWWIVVPVMVLLAGALLPMLFTVKKTMKCVIVYCAQDQTYAEPILHDFEKETGLRVRAVYDSEAVKTVGLANRLLAERSHPQCDVFWGNEEMRTRQLEQMAVWRETNGVASFGARARCIVINTNLIAPDALPKSLLEITNAQWQGRFAIAFPQYGTTATHFHVLRQLWGDESWQQWCRRLVANDTRVLDGNSTVVKMVGRGEAQIGLTDTDDVQAGQREGLPVSRGPDLPETLLFIPNTVGIVRDAPHPENAQKLADYLQRPATVEQLMKAGAIQYAAPPSGVNALKPDWSRLLTDLETVTEEINRIFLR